MNTPPEHWPDGLHILCVRLDNLGDVLMTTPAFGALKRTWPTCRLTLLTSPAGAALTNHLTDIDRVLTTDVPWMSSSATDRSALPALIDQLRTYQFDAAILFTVQSQSPLPAAMLCYMAGIPRVLGHCRENPYQLLTDWVPDTEVLIATRHEVDRQLALVAAVGCATPAGPLTVSVHDTDRLIAHTRLVENGLRTELPWLVLHPGVSEAKRRYPAEQFAQAMHQLRQHTNYQIVLTGSRDEALLTAQLAEQIQTDGQSAPVVDLAGQLSLGQLIGLLSDAPLLIANNTGPVHIAAAVGTPVVVLYAKTNPQHTPWQVPNRVLYFDVPAGMQSRNILLQQFPPDLPSTASPDAIVQAVVDLHRIDRPVEFAESVP